MKKTMNMKQIAAAASAAVCAYFALSLSAAAVDNGLSVYIDGKKTEFDVPPIITEGRTMVPMRTIFEALGMDIEWNDETKTVTGKKDGTTVTMQVGNSEMQVGRNKITLDAPPIIRDERTLVPVRAVAEALGVDVEWYDEIKTVSVVSGKSGREYTELYDLNHEKKQVDTDYAEKFLSIGWRENLDGLYTKLYYASVEADIPVSTLEDNLETGWSEEKSPISMTSESIYQIDGESMRLFWHPRNTSGKDITKYTVTLYYLEKNGNGGYKKKTPTVTATAKDGELLGITTTVKENCFVEIYDMKDCRSAFIGEVSVRYKDGKTEQFWCGQEVTNGDEWSGSVYGEDFELSSSVGKGSVIYNVYDTDGESTKMKYSEFTDARAKGEKLYLTPVDEFYCSDGTVIIASESSAGGLKKDGLTTDPKDVMVKMYNDLGNIESVMPGEVYGRKSEGWKIYSAPIKVLYRADGSTVAVEESEVNKYLGNGFFASRDEIVTTVYAPDGRSLEILKTEFNNYLSVGWYAEPVMMVYDSNGYGQVVLVSEKEKYVSDGYYTDIEQLYLTVYAPDGRTEKILPYEAQGYLSVGWYSEPVTVVYSSSGESKIILSAKLDEYLTAGWASSPEDFYRSYFSLTGSVRGLKSDEGAYISAGWKMVPYPISLNNVCRLERANVWSQYSYRLYWHPTNVSEKSIKSYRVAYYIPENGEYYENYEDFDIEVAPGGQLGHSELGDSFFVSIQPGCDTVIIGNVTVEYDDGAIETFWCGQTVKIGAEAWDGTLYNEQFEIVPVQYSDGSYIIAPAGNTLG